MILASKQQNMMQGGMTGEAVGQWFLELVKGFARTGVYLVNVELPIGADIEKTTGRII